MRAAILNGVNGAIVVAPQHEIFRQTGDADRRAGDSPARQRRIPKVQQPTVHAILDILAVNHCYLLQMRTDPGSGPCKLTQLLERLLEAALGPRIAGRCAYALAIERS